MMLQGTSKLDETGGLSWAYTDTPQYIYIYRLQYYPYHPCMDIYLHGWLIFMCNVGK